MPSELTEPHEDYLERIYELFLEKKWVRPIDVAARLGISPASVTRMLQKLAAAGYLEVEKYRGFIMTPKGEAVGQRVQNKHKILEEFLRKIGVSETVVQQDVERLEHHVSSETLQKIAEFTNKQ